MDASDSAPRLDDPALPYAEVEYGDYLKLRRRKIELDTARREVEKRYENLSKCQLDNMTCAKAQLDQARQKENDCFKEFERAHDKVVTIISRLVRPRSSTGARSIAELEDDIDTSALGLVSKARTRNIRAPTGVTAGPSSRATRHTQARAISTRVSSDPVIRALASRASGNASLKALMKITATGNANKKQLLAFQKVIDEVTVTLNGDIAQAASLEHIKQEPASDS
jgi:hypothetical protein